MKNHNTVDPETVYAPEDQPSDKPVELPTQYTYDAHVLDSVNEMPNQEPDLQTASSGKDDPGMEWMQKRNYLVNHFARMNRKKRARDIMLVIFTPTP